MLGDGLEASDVVVVRELKLHVQYNGRAGRVVARPTASGRIPVELFLCNRQTLLLFKENLLPVRTAQEALSAEVFEEDRVELLTFFVLNMGAPRLSYASEEALPPTRRGTPAACGI